jgi:hypothetical protein
MPSSSQTRSLSPPAGPPEPCRLRVKPCPNLLERLVRLPNQAEQGGVFLQVQDQDGKERFGRLWKTRGEGVRAGEYEGFPFCEKIFCRQKGSSEMVVERSGG